MPATSLPCSWQRCSFDGGRVRPGALVRRPPFMAQPELAPCDSVDRPQAGGGRKGRLFLFGSCSRRITAFLVLVSCCVVFCCVVLFVGVKGERRALGRPPRRVLRSIASRHGCMRVLARARAHVFFLCVSCIAAFSIVARTRLVVPSPPDYEVAAVF